MSSDADGSFVFSIFLTERGGLNILILNERVHKEGGAVCNHFSSKDARIAAFIPDRWQAKASKNKFCRFKNDTRSDIHVQL